MLRRIRRRFFTAPSCPFPPSASRFAPPRRAPCPILLNWHGCPRSSVDRASASGAEGRRFESCRGRHKTLNDLGFHRSSGGGIPGDFHKTTQKTTHFGRNDAARVGDASRMRLSSAGRHEPHVATVPPFAACLTNRASLLLATHVQKRPSLRRNNAPAPQHHPRARSRPHVGMFAPHVSVFQVRRFLCALFLPRATGGRLSSVYPPPLSGLLGLSPRSAGCGRSCPIFDY